MFLKGHAWTLIRSHHRLCVKKTLAAFISICRRSTFSHFQTKYHKGLVLGFSNARVCPCTRTMEMSGQTYRRRNGERSAALGGSWHLLFGERNAGTCRERAEGSASWPASLGLVSHPVLITIHTTQHQMARCLTKCSMSYRKVPVSESWGHHSPTLKTTAGEAAPI